MIDPIVLVRSLFAAITVIDLAYASRSSVSSPHKTTSLVLTEPENLEEPAREYWGCKYCDTLNDLDAIKCILCGASRRRTY